VTQAGRSPGLRHHLAVMSHAGSGRRPALTDTPFGVRPGRAVRWAVVAPFRAAGDSYGDIPMLDFTQ
jgi:hypothetical protein